METLPTSFLFKFLILLLGIETCRAALKVHDKLESGSDKILKKRQAPYYPQPPQVAPYYPPLPNYNNYPPPPAPYNYPQPNNNYGYNGNNNYGYNSNNNYGYNGGGSNSGGYGYENQESYGGSCYNSATCNCYEPYNLYPCHAGSDPTSEYSEYGYGRSNDCACTEAHHPNGCTLVNCTTSTSVTNDPWCLCTTGASPTNCFGYFAYFDTQSNTQSMQQLRAQQMQQFQHSSVQNQQTQFDSQSLQSSDTESDSQLQNAFVSNSDLLDALALQDTLSDSDLLSLGNLKTESLLSNGLLGGLGSLGKVGNVVQEGHNVVGGAAESRQGLINAGLLNKETIMTKQVPATKVFEVIQQAPQLQQIQFV